MTDWHGIGEIYVGYIRYTCLSVSWYFIKLLLPTLVCIWGNIGRSWWPRH